MIYQVGKIYHPSKKEFAYKEVEYDAEGWVDTRKFLPADCDLCLLKIAGKKIVSGWLCGSTWDGKKLEKEDRIRYWKPFDENRKI